MAKCPTSSLCHTHMISPPLVPSVSSSSLPCVTLVTMGEELTNTTEPTLLRALLRARHWQKHSTFATEWDRVARKIDPKLVGSWPKHAQFYRWLRGELHELPYPDACRVLEALFPDYNVRELFQPYDPNAATQLALSSNKPTKPTDECNPLLNAKVTTLWPRTNPDVLDDLVTRVKNAKSEISVFGLTRNF